MNQGEERHFLQLIFSNT